MRKNLILKLKKLNSIVSYIMLLLKKAVYVDWFGNCLEHVLVLLSVDEEKKIHFEGLKLQKFYRFPSK